MDEKTIIEALGRIKGKNKNEGRALVITLYYSGAKPCEVLALKAKNVKRENQYVLLEIQETKRTRRRVIYLPYKKKLVKELYKFSRAVFEDMLLFHHFKGKHTRRRGGREYIETSDAARYHLRKWFKGVVPDFSRNRFTKLTKAGATIEQLMAVKGSKTLRGVAPFFVASQEAAKKAARLID